jgi:dihydroorotate dehydrogenase electron transfer subunit
LSKPPRTFDARILENRPVGGYFRLVLEDRHGVLADALPGQFLNLKVQPGWSPLLRRPFSIARLRRGRGKALEVEVLYAVVREGTRLLSQKVQGGTVDVLGPLGRPFPHLDREHPALLVGGGIGIPPLIYLAEHLVARRVPVSVFLGARTGADVVGREVFRGLGVPLAVYTDDGSLGHRGFVTDLLARHLGSGRCPKGTVIHACGPRPMFRSITEIARKHRTPAYLSWEESMACGLGICLTCSCPVVEGEALRMVRTCVEGPVFEASQIRWDRLEAGA